MLSPRLRERFRHPAIGVLIVYIIGVLVRVDYSLRLHPPEAWLISDMGNYVALARQFAFSGEPIHAWQIVLPLGYPQLLAFLISGSGSLARAAHFQLVVSALIPLAVGWLGWATFGARTALASIAVASLYFPFIEYGALFLSEIHFIFWLTVTFAALFSARRSRRRIPTLLMSVTAGVSLSIAASFKALAVPVVAAFFAVDALGLLLANRSGGSGSRQRLGIWIQRAALSVVSAIPLFALLARTCTRANHGKFCMLGRTGADFLLGHYGRIADILWAPIEGASDYDSPRGYGSPSAYLHHYDAHARVPFTLMDDAANRAEAWRWISAHPFEALVLSLEHVYDTFFGLMLWPAFGEPFWATAQIFQYAFVVLLFIPTVLACARVLERGVRAFLTSETLLVLSPVLGLMVMVAMATGEIRYRIPFDIFFISIACAFVVGDIRRVDGPFGRAPAALEQPL